MASCFQEYKYKSFNHPSQLENPKNIFWCAAKDNWASQISEVALRKELEQWKFPFLPWGQ